MVIFVKVTQGLGTRVKMMGEENLVIDFTIGGQMVIDWFLSTLQDTLQ